MLNALIAVSEARAAALTAANLSVPTVQTVRALVDTGASCTCVDPTVLKALGLSPTGSVPILTPSSGTTPHPTDQYDVGLAIPGSDVAQAPLIHQTIPVIESDLSAQGIEALIGRDVLASCVLVYNGVTGHFTLAF